MITFFRWNRVVPFAAPWMAARNTIGSQPESFDEAVALQRGHHILRTGGFVSAAFRQQRRNRALVEPHQQNQRECENPVQHRCKSNQIVANLPARRHKFRIPESSLTFVL